MKGWVIDPPDGWQYGFPKAIPIAVVRSADALSRWLIENGYPEKDVPLALVHSRYWKSG